MNISITYNDLQLTNTTVNVAQVKDSFDPAKCCSLPGEAVFLCDTRAAGPDASFERLSLETYALICAKKMAL